MVHHLSKLIAIALLSCASSIAHNQRLRSICDRPHNLLLLDVTITTTSKLLGHSSNDDPSNPENENDDESFDPCKAARDELQATLDTREDVTNVTSIDRRLASLTADEKVEQQEEAAVMEINEKHLQTSKAEYEGQAGLLHEEMQVVGSCSEAAHLALFHAFESRQRGDPLNSQSALLNLASERIECSEKKLKEIMPLRTKVLETRETYKSDEKTAEASEQRVRTLIKHQFTFAKKACEDLHVMSDKANRRLLSILAVTHMDAKTATSFFKETSTIDDNMMLAVQKGNVASAQAKVFHEALMARRKTTCEREQRLMDELGVTEAANGGEEDPYKNVNHEEAMRYPEVDRLRGELNGILVEYSKARENANLVVALFDGSAKSADAASGAASGPAAGASGPAAGASGPAAGASGPASGASGAAK